MAFYEIVWTESGPKVKLGVKLLIGKQSDYGLWAIMTHRTLPVLRTGGVPDAKAPTSVVVPASDKQAAVTCWRTKHPANKQFNIRFAREAHAHAHSLK